MQLSPCTHAKALRAHAYAREGACAGRGDRTTARVMRNRILSNSEVGQYTYATAGAGARPHALASINGQAGKLTNPQYSYDAHGNIQSVTGANGGQRTHS
jgi:YD repeat-containing protein